MKMYFTAIVLPSALNEKVLKYKNRMLEKYGCRVALKSPAHITLLPPFWMNEEREEEFFNDVHAVSHTKSFSMVTNDFSSFQPGTIFIAVKKNDELSGLKTLSDAHFSKKDYGVKIDSRPFHPHITIATRDLHKKDYKEAWDYFREKKFEEEWTVTSISVLKHNGRQWDVVYTAALEI